MTGEQLALVVAVARPPQRSGHAVHESTGRTHASHLGKSQLHPRHVLEGGHREHEIEAVVR